MNTNWRNWYLTGAMALEGVVRPLKDPQVITANFASPEVVAEWPLSRIISGLSTRLNPDMVADSRIKITFKASDTKEHQSLELRGAVAQFHQCQGLLWGYRWEYDHWARLGNEGWAYDDMICKIDRVLLSASFIYF